MPSPGLMVLQVPIRAMTIHRKQCLASLRGPQSTGIGSDKSGYGTKNNLIRTPTSGDYDGNWDSPLPSCLDISTVALLPSFVGHTVQGQ